MVFKGEKLFCLAANLWETFQKNYFGRVHQKGHFFIFRLLIVHLNKPLFCTTSVPQLRSGLT